MEKVFWYGPKKPKNKKLKDVGVLLVHGYSGTPMEMGSIGKYLGSKELRCVAITLTGHGGRPKDLVDIKKKTKPRTNSKSKSSAITNQYPISGAQKRAILSFCKKNNLSQEDIDKLVEGNFGTTFENLSTTQASSLIVMLQKSA